MLDPALPGTLLGPGFADLCEDVIPIHVTRTPDATEALCGARVLPKPAVPEAVELGLRRPDGSLVTLDEVELEMGWIGNLPRHREATKVGHPCRECLEKVTKLRDRAAAPGRKAAAKIEGKAQRAEAAQARKAAREAAALEARETKAAARKTMLAEQLAAELAADEDDDYGDD